MEQFLNLFTYERIERGEQNNIYYNCTLLCDLNGHKKGEHFHSIVGQLSLYLFEDDGNDFDEDYIMI